VSQESPPSPPVTDLLLYRTPDGRDRIEVRLHDETVWLTQAQMAELFETTKQNVSLHLRNIFADGELHPERTIKEYLTVRNEGSREVSRNVTHYRLEAIMAVGFRVRSRRGTQFRQWATAQLRDLVVKGFVMDDERLKAGRNVGVDYFDELLERIRDIRASERRFYQKIRDIYALAVDYDPKADETRGFFQEVQNKLHFAVSGRTAAELIAERADASQPNMGLATWKGAEVRKADVTVAKNYLNADEMTALNRLVTMYLDFAEDQAKRRRQIFQRDWKRKLDAFLELNDRDILGSAGRVSKAAADVLAQEQYDRFRAARIAQDDARAALEHDAELRAIEDRAARNLQTPDKDSAP
jgi:hypothetical protein